MRKGHMVPQVHLSGVSSRMPYCIPVAAICCMALLAGCAGVVVDALAKKMATGMKYQEMEETLPSLHHGLGRVFVYRTAQSTESSLRMGDGIRKNATFYTIGDMAYELVWEAFRYVDLPEGQYEVTSGDDVLTGRSFMGQGRFQKGSNRIQVTVSAGSEIFVRLDGIGDEFFPVLIENGQACEEIQELPYQKRTMETKEGRISAP